MKHAFKLCHANNDHITTKYRQYLNDLNFKWDRFRRHHSLMTSVTELVSEFMFMYSGMQGNWSPATNSIICCLHSPLKLNIHTKVCSNLFGGLLSRPFPFSAHKIWWVIHWSDRPNRKTITC
ncbi:hypothetical protein AVEN_22001-1 [Araneus ventricosus]|uniref:Uncharacterized protein n=1 Tax=Araneus ventricosus TaxID=182803 RepID=A0A4Y2X3B8_ARAVE|nr:hypothetical protein AVEN_22001-1 [Araneus ventricosus]